MSHTKQIHPFLDTLEDDVIKQVAYDHLQLLLDKVAISIAAKELRLYVPTLMRILNADLPIEAINYLTACYIIFMCETNVRILRILDAPRTGRAYNARAHESVAAANARKEKVKT